LAKGTSNHRELPAWIVFGSFSLCARDEEPRYAAIAAFNLNVKLLGAAGGMQIVSADLGFTATPSIAPAAKLLCHKSNCSLFDPFVGSHPRSD
jgi:hypothetical protein